MARCGGGREHSAWRLPSTLLLLVAACVPSSAWEQPRTPEPAIRAVPAVVVVSIDGLRPDAIAEFGARTLQALADNGAWTLTARTVEPSITLPSHASMLTGVPPAVHGITWNDDRTRQLGRVPVPTVFDIAEAHQLHSAAFFGKAKLRHLMDGTSPRLAVAPHGLAVRLAPRIVEDVEHYLRFERPDLLFVHISDPDVAGHTFGWMRWLYGSAVLRSDAALARLIAAADGAWGRCGYTLIVTSDHGGVGREHAAPDERNILIPWIAWGAGVRPGPLSNGVRTEDTAATVLHLLGLAVPDAWTGRPVLDALQPEGRGRQAAPAQAGRLSACEEP
jgi:predicted AlkP superfamily pyrophosphatase or phosphodiesterase